jgi:hypothetical protein
VTGGASCPQPSSSTFPPETGARDLDARGLNPDPPPPTLVGVKAGFEDNGGGGPPDEGLAPPPEYLEPEESSTFLIMASGVRSRSDRAVI